MQPLTWPSRSRAYHALLATTIVTGAGVSGNRALAADTAPVSSTPIDASIAASADAGADGEQGEGIVVTGNRARATTTIDSPAPVQVIDSPTLERLGANSSLRDALTALLPSFNQQTVSSSSWNSVARPAGLRGLGGAHVLILVNGKRRHNAALNDLSTSTDSGANPVDLDLIPVSAIARIEVLTDGAAAQYGSDAIGGVINIILKDADHGGSLSFTAGQRYGYRGHSDGRNLEANGNIGFKLGEGGFINFAATLRQNRAALRSIPATGAFYYPLANGAPDPRESRDKTVFAGGLPDVRQGIFLYNAEVPVGPSTTFYSSSTYGIRRAIVGQNFRRPNSTNDIVSIYPDGYAPNYTLHESDFQTLWGLKGNLSGWKWDISSTYGENYARNGSTNTINASLGEDSPTSFSTFNAKFAQWTNNLDISKSFDIGLALPLQFSFGAEHRYERYTTTSGDPLSYANGGYRYTSGPLAGQYATVGAQGAITLTPGDQANLHRNSLAVYGDVGFNPVRRWFVDLAGRFEHYDDSAGNTVSGKFTTRYDFSPAFALRGTISNGFRAPSLAQEGYAQTSNQYTVVNGVQTYITSKSVTPQSALGQALGARALKPERSLNISFGGTLKLAPAFTLTADAYQIQLDHRIVQTGYLTGSGVNAILAASGFSSGQAIRYFANAIDTRTRGVEVTANYTRKIPHIGDLALTLGYNHNVTRITAIADSPSQLTALNLTLFDRSVQGAIKYSAPQDKLILSQNFSTGKLRVNTRETYYGPFANIATVAASDQFYGAKWVADIDVSYQLTPDFNLAVGANNVFNTYPDKNTVPDTNGFPPYPGQSPFGFYGGYYYARLSYTF